MERQKIFWVVLSVSVFMVIVLVVGVFLLRQNAGTGGATSASGAGTQVYEYQRPAQPETTGQADGGSGTETMHFYIGEGDQGGIDEAANGTTGTAPGATGTSPTGLTGAQDSGTTALTGSTGAAATGASTAANAAATGATARTGGTATTARAPASKPATTKVTEYWIQTGSYQSQSKAEDLVSRLGDKGLNGRVFSFSLQGATWFRVRVGPYTSKGEANKFLAEVKKLQGLETSFIAQVAATRPK
jgi:DedD protein